MSFVEVHLGVYALLARLLIVHKTVYIPRQEQKKNHFQSCEKNCRQTFPKYCYLLIFILILAHSKPQKVEDFTKQTLLKISTD
jgi:hypothetical protein